MLIVKTVSCDTFRSWAEKSGLWYSYKANPQQGDLVIFDFSGNHSRNQHVGILVSRTGDTITTIEGNTSVTSDDNGGAVMRRTRHTSKVTGYIRPKWTATQTAAKLLEIAASQVGIKEVPTGSNNVKYNTWFYGRSVSGSDYPWCAAFVSWCFAVLAGGVTWEKSTTTQEEGYCMVQAKTLRYGMTGSAVKKLQILLNGLGYSCGTVDGAFGSKTSRAASDFQKDYGLSVDGVVGAATWGKLLA